MIKVYNYSTHFPPQLRYFNTAKYPTEENIQRY